MRFSCSPKATMVKAVIQKRSMGSKMQRKAVSTVDFAQAECKVAQGLVDTGDGRKGFEYFVYSTQTNNLEASAAHCQHQQAESLPHCLRTYWSCQPPHPVGFPRKPLPSSHPPSPRPLPEPLSEPQQAQSLHSPLGASHSPWSNQNQY